MTGRDDKLPSVLVLAQDGRTAPLRTLVPLSEAEAALASGDRYRRWIPGGNAGALRWCMRGGGWGIKSVRCRELKNAMCREHGDPVVEGVWRCSMYGGSTGPVSLSYDPALSQQPGIPFSAIPETQPLFA